MWISFKDEQPKDGQIVDVLVELPTGPERFCNAYFDTYESAWCYDFENTRHRVIFTADPPSYWMSTPELPDDLKSKESAQ